MGATDSSVKQHWSSFQIAKQRHNVVILVAGNVVDLKQLEAVQRLGFHTTVLLAGWIIPKHVVKDWPDWHALVPAFVASYGSDELRELEIGTEFLGAIEEDEEVRLTEVDLATSRRWRRGSACTPR